MRIAFMGTPSFAVPSIAGLLEHGHDLVLVVSQPDRPAGRGRHSVAPPVAMFAREHQLRLFQPTSLKPPEAVAKVREAQADVIVVVAFGLLLRREMLDLPPLGCLNVHASLLPRHRGASPISAAILEGDAETGVCLMRMELGLDTGPVLACDRTVIEPRDDTPSLTDRLAMLGRNLLIATLPAWEAGRVHPVPQDEALATHSTKIRREDARLEWSLPAEQLWGCVRAYRGWPDAYTFWRKQQLKVLSAHPDPSIPTGARPGQVVATGEAGAQRPAVVTSDGILVLDTMSLEGRKPTGGADFLRGHRDFVGSILD